MSCKEGFICINSGGGKSSYDTHNFSHLLFYVHFITFPVRKSKSFLALSSLWQSAAINVFDSFVHTQKTPHIMFTLETINSWSLNYLWLSVFHKQRKTQSCWFGNKKLQKKEIWTISPTLFINATPLQMLELYLA
jgi:hypothetical protein